MKLEMGESLISSWMKHVKCCQVVQMNWKPFSEWGVQFKGLEVLFDEVRAEFSEYNIFGQNGFAQLMAQAEIDVVGIALLEETPCVYLADIAFHEAGLNYGNNIERVLKKMARMVFCSRYYFGDYRTEIIFASPRIGVQCYQDLTIQVQRMMDFLNLKGVSCDLRVIGNQDFLNHILNPVLEITPHVADTSDLFLRSIKLLRSSEAYYNVGDPQIERTENAETTSHEQDDMIDIELMRVGQIANQILRGYLEEHQIIETELAQFLSSEDSRRIFHLNHPLLIKFETMNQNNSRRYYQSPLNINGDFYALCNDWYDTPRNPDKEMLLQWLRTKKVI